MRIPKHEKAMIVPVPLRLEQDVGLGDLMKRVAAGIGARPCQGCDRRAERLNRLVMFRGTRGR